MVHLDIGVLENKDDLLESAFQRTVEFVAESVSKLRLPASNIPELPNCSSSRRVLVFGREADQRAQHIAERNFFSHTVGSPSYEEPDAPGVFWVSDVAELEDLDDETFDAVMVFNLSSSSSFLSSFHHLQRLLKPGGVLAGTGVFQGFQRSKEGQSSLLGDIVDADLSLCEFRSLIEDNGFLVHINMDLSLQGDIVLAVEEDAKRSEFHADLLNSVGLICARFLASKVSCYVRKNPSMSPLSLASHNPTISISSLSPAPPLLPPKDPVVVTGISLGLPNELRQECSVFDARNLERIFAGENFISQLTSDQKQRIINQNVVQVLKVDGQRVKRKLCKPTEVISLASRLGHFDLVKEYGVPPHVVETLDITYQLAIAAGLEACVSAGIPVLERTESKDNASLIAKVHPLPESMQAETGVIFASSFPCTDSCVQEISLCSAHHTRRFLEECQAVDFDKLRKAQANNEEYEFDRKLLFKLLVMANNQLAELIRARGPNTHVNAACASTSQAVAIAHDWLRLGRCRRVIVISADNTTNDNLLPYIGTGFLALTAASIAPTIETGALPFDKRRNGMILGMGAVGMVLELSSCALARSARPLAELVGSHFVNSAFHGSLLDREHISTELCSFIKKVEKDQGIPAAELARNLIYYSHETQTSAQGGCAKAEMDALSLAFGADAKPQIMIANTKGFTGHPMGVGLEDVVAVASIDQGLCPPIANFKEKDPCLGDILLAHGGSHNRTYALRFSAGFGSQFVFLLFKKWSDDCLQPCRSPGVVADLDFLTTDGLLEQPACTEIADGEAGEHYDSDTDCAKPHTAASDLAPPLLRFRKHYQHQAGNDAILDPPKMIDDDEEPSFMQSMQPSGTAHRELRRVARIVPADVQDSCTLM